MKKVILLFASLLFVFISYAQVSYLQYRHVPNDKEQEFVEKETKYWSKVAKAAIDKGLMTGWALWRKVSVTNPDAPNYVFVNSFASIDKIDQAAIWSDENISKMGVSPDMVETNSFTTVPFDCWVQLEDFVQGDYKFAVVNYAKPESLSGFIEENKTLWKPFHESNITAKNMGMTSWGLMSVIFPKGNQAKFSCFTWDGFNTMADVMKFMSYSSPTDTASPWTDILSKSKMGEIMPNGFEYSLVYELVMSID